MTRDEAIKTVLEYKRAQNDKKVSAREKQLATLAKGNADYSKCSNDIAALGAKLAVTALSGNNSQLEEIKERLEKLYEKRDDIIRSAGIEDIKYDCEKCRDTGYADGALCECVKTAAAALVLRELAKSSLCKSCTFEDFELSYYTDAQANKRMSAILETAKKFAAGFCADTRENLLFMGNTGLGKTHLSLAIANEVIKKGYDVLYSPAYNLFGEIESEHFSKHTNQTYDNAVNCDLLIIDDLGGEFVSPYIQSVAYNIINTRLNNGKPMIINTNLGFSQIENMYTPRIASRFAGEFTCKMFLGQDVRMLKKALNEQ